MFRIVKNVEHKQAQTEPDHQNYKVANTVGGLQKNKSMRTWNYLTIKSRVFFQLSKCEEDFVGFYFLMPLSQFLFKSAGFYCNGQFCG